MSDKQTIEVGTLYDLNKQIIAQLPPHDEHQMQLNYEIIGDWFSVPRHPDYFMLMCKELSDFTLLHLHDFNFAKAVQELKEILAERGEVHSIQYIHGEDVFEIWIKNTKTNEYFMYMLFNANWMVVEVE